MNIPLVGTFENAFFVPEPITEVLCKIICETMENVGISTYAPAIQNFYSYCNSARKGEQGGLLNLELTRFSITLEDRTQLQSVFATAMSSLNDAGDYLSADYLNNFELTKPDPDNRNGWDFPLKVSNLQTTLLFMQLSLEDEPLPCKRRILIFSETPYIFSKGYLLG